MHVSTNSVFIAALVWSTVSVPLGQTLLAQSSSPQKWELPSGTTVKDNGPRTYRFTVDYNTANRTGEIVHRQRVTGEYTRGLSGGDVMWKDVAQADADGPTGAFGAAKTRDFMEGFRYPNDLSATMKPDFFKAFPPTAVFERNLVWDTGMIEQFGQQFFGQLKLNVPVHAAANETVHMPGVGVFNNRDIVLEWIGLSRRNGSDCAVILYQAFFNPLEIVNAGMSLKGRSDYWGEIWVSLATKQIEYGTLYENVMGEMTLPGQAAPQLISVLRRGELEPVNAK
jgi:hypothetical protein